MISVKRTFFSWPFGENRLTTFNSLHWIGKWNLSVNQSCLIERTRLKLSPTKYYTSYTMRIKIKLNRFSARKSSALETQTFFLIFYATWTEAKYNLNQLRRERERERERCMRVAKSTFRRKTHGGPSKVHKSEMRDAIVPDKLVCITNLTEGKSAATVINLPNE